MCSNEKQIRGACKATLPPVPLFQQKAPFPALPLEMLLEKKPLHVQSHFFSPLPVYFLISLWG